MSDNISKSTSSTFNVKIENDSDEDSVMDIIVPEGWISCIVCQKTGIKDSFYGKKKNFCSPLCHKLMQQHYQPSARYSNRSLLAIPQLETSPTILPSSEPSKKQRKSSKIPPSSFYDDIIDDSASHYDSYIPLYLSERSGALSQVNPLHRAFELLKFAPVSNFLHAPMSEFWEDHFIKSNVCVDVKQQYRKFFWRCRLLNSFGYFIKLQYMGSSEPNSFFYNNFRIRNLFPMCYADDVKGDYSPPCQLRNLNIRKMWEESRNCQTIRQDLHSLFRESIQDRFDPQILYEVINLNNPSEYVPAKLVKNFGDFKLMSYDVPDRFLPAYKEIWVHPKSPFFRITGWSQLVGHQLLSPTSYAVLSLYTLTKCDQLVEEYLINDMVLFEPNLLNNFSVGSYLEILDPFSYKMKIGVVTQKLRFGFMMVGIVDLDEEEEVTLQFCQHVTSPLIYGFGYSSTREIPLYVSETKLYDPQDPQYESFRNKVNENIAPYSCFRRQVSVNKFVEGSFLETFNLTDHGAISYALIYRIVGRLLCLKFINKPLDFEMWIDYQNPHLLPFGYTHMLDLPKDMTSLKIDSLKYCELYLKVCDVKMMLQQLRNAKNPIETKVISVKDGLLKPMSFSASSELPNGRIRIIEAPNISVSPTSNNNNVDRTKSNTSEPNSLWTQSLVEKFLIGPTLRSNQLNESNSNVKAMLPKNVVLFDSKQFKNGIQGGKLQLVHGSPSSKFIQISSFSKVQPVKRTYSNLENDGESSKNNIKGMELVEIEKKSRNDDSQLVLMKAGLKRKHDDHSDESNEIEIKQQKLVENKNKLTNFVIIKSGDSKKWEEMDVLAKNRLIVKSFKKTESSICSNKDSIKQLKLEKDSSTDKQDVEKLEGSKVPVIEIDAVSKSSTLISAKTDLSESKPEKTQANLKDSELAKSSTAVKSSEEKKVVRVLLKSNVTKAAEPTTATLSSEIKSNNSDSKVFLSSITSANSGSKDQQQNKVLILYGSSVSKNDNSDSQAKLKTVTKPTPIAISQNQSSSQPSMKINISPSNPNIKLIYKSTVPISSSSLTSSSPTPYKIISVNSKSEAKYPTLSDVFRKKVSKLSVQATSLPDSSNTLESNKPTTSSFNKSTDSNNSNNLKVKVLSRNPSTKSQPNVDQTKPEKTGDVVILDDTSQTKSTENEKVFQTSSETSEVIPPQTTEHKNEMKKDFEKRKNDEQLAKFMKVNYPSLSLLKLVIANTEGGLKVDESHNELNLTDLDENPFNWLPSATRQFFLLNYVDEDFLKLFYDKYQNMNGRELLTTSIERMYGRVNLLKFKLLLHLKLKQLKK